MPCPSPWPEQDDSSLSDFYGPAGDEGRLTNLAVSGLGVQYGGAPVSTIRCHEKVAPSLLRVLQKLKSGPFAGVLSRYAGCYNFRRMRGGSSFSLHARGAAIDIDPDTNGMHDQWPGSATMPIEVMEEFAREGWLPAGAFWGHDAMHMQATR
jgi:hypothetical protein